MSELEPIQSVGFIGLGNQGEPIAKRLIAAGLVTSLWARTPRTLEAFAGLPFHRAGTIAELAARSDLVSTCVVDDAGVRDIANAALPNMKRGAVFAIHSTVHPDLCSALAEEAQPFGVTVIDAPVSGGRAAAERGELAVMVGGDPVAIARCEPAFRAFATTVMRMGEIGSGQTTKLVNNVLMGANLTLAHAALRLGAELGIDAEALGAILLASSGRSFSLGMRLQLGDPAAYAHGAVLGRKDIGLVRSLGGRESASGELLAQTASLFVDLAECSVRDQAADGHCQAKLTDR